MEGAFEAYLTWRRRWEKLDKEFTSFLLAKWSFATNGISGYYKKVGSLYT